VLHVLLEVVLPVLLVAVAGGVVGRRLSLSLETMSKVVFYLFSPSLVFVSIADTNVTGGDMARVLTVAALVFGINAVVSFMWAGMRGADARTRAALVLSGSVVNQGNLGLPMARLAFGEEGLQVAVVIFVASVVLWSTAGIALGTIARGLHSPRRAITAPLRYPSIYAAIAGGVVNVANIDLPVAVRETTGTLAQAAIPCMLVVLGLQFRRPRLGGLLDPAVTTSNRLLLGPLVAWPLAAVLGLGGVTADTSVMMAGMPTAVMSTILAAELDANAELVVSTVILSTLCSIVTLTFLIALLR
jgi:predicted permease